LKECSGTHLVISETATQLLANTLVAASVYALVALGFAVIYSTTRFFHFAHGIVFAFGAYATFFLHGSLGCPLPVAMGLGVIGGMGLGCLIEVAAYRPLRRKGSSSLVLLVASLGIYVALQNLLSLCFGDDARTIRSPVVEEGVRLAGARITLVQLATSAVCIALLCATQLLLNRSKIGKAIRAVGSDSYLAEASGIAAERVLVWTYALGSALGAVAGILVALDIDMTPTMGMNALMVAVVVTVVGGIGGIRGLAIGALLLAGAQQFVSWVFGAEWKDAMAFVILVAFLLFRPHGTAGLTLLRTRR
jgi:branched-chain amino acid transport system permease protein